MDAWLKRYLNKHGKFTVGVLAVVVAALFIFWPQTNNANNEVSIYEDEMIVSVDQYKALQQSVITLQEGMKLLLAGQPQPGTPAQQQFACMQNTEDYKDGFLQINTILNCMNLQLIDAKSKD